MMIGPLMMDVEGLTLNQDDRDFLQRPCVGGLILFKRNYENRRQLCELVQSIRSVRSDIIIAVDQEGGRVQRLQEDGFSRLPPMQRLRKQAQLFPENIEHSALQLGYLMASEVLACGIDISFAPVLDVDESFSSIIGDRSFSDDPDEVIRLAGAFMQGMSQAGMATTGKHFPGHGAVQEDSHLTLPVDNRSWEQIAERDLAPFKVLLGQLDAVMPAHIVFSQIDDKAVGFSPLWLKNKLRQDLGFDGVIFSDDLSMEGAVSAGSYADRTQVALEAGCDMVLVCNNRAGALEAAEFLESYSFCSESQRRLQTMLARRSWQWDELAGDENWQAGAKVAKQLLA